MRYTPTVEDLKRAYAVALTDIFRPFRETKISIQEENKNHRIAGIYEVISKGFEDLTTVKAVARLNETLWAMFLHEEEYAYLSTISKTSVKQIIAKARKSLRFRLGKEFK